VGRNIEQALEVNKERRRRRRIGKEERKISRRWSNRRNRERKGRREIG
jgi:hypothetical protein